MASAKLISLVNKEADKIVKLLPPRRYHKIQPKVELHDRYKFLFGKGCLKLVGGSNNEEKVDYCQHWQPYLEIETETRRHTKVLSRPFSVFYASGSSEPHNATDVSLEEFELFLKLISTGELKLQVQEAIAKTEAGELEDIRSHKQSIRDYEDKEKALISSFIGGDFRKRPSPAKHCSKCGRQL
jgi:hypothetical protein